MDGSKVSQAFLKLAGMDGKKVLGQEQLVDVRYKKGSLYDVKRKNWFHTMCHVKGREAG